LYFLFKDELFPHYFFLIFKIIEKQSNINKFSLKILLLTLNKLDHCFYMPLFLSPNLGLLSLIPILSKIIYQSNKNSTYIVNLSYSFLNFIWKSSSPLFYIVYISLLCLSYKSCSYCCTI